VLLLLVLALQVLQKPMDPFRARDKNASHEQKRRLRKLNLPKSLRPEGPKTKSDPKATNLIKNQNPFN